MVYTYCRSWYNNNTPHKDDYIKANRKASREAEIKEHGHPVCYKRVHESKKVYNRRKIKAADKKLPYFFSFGIVSVSQ